MKEFSHFFQKPQDEEQRSHATNKRFSQTEKEEKVWTEMGCRNSLLVHQEDVWRTCVCSQVSKHGKRDGSEGIAVQPVHKIGLTVTGVI